MSTQLSRRPALSAGVVGLGLIGGSVARALVEAGWSVGGIDVDQSAAEQALESGVITQIGLPENAAVTIVATPVDAIVDGVELALETTAGYVIDTGSVKGVIADQIADPRFVPTHPMAGSEQSGLSGARFDLFEGAAWVLTPTASTSDEALAFVHDLVVQLGADPLTVSPDAHDRMVATVSHVPHLTAAALMSVADERSDEHLAMLRMAAGGFRDMTRIAAGSPDIWPSICLQNGPAIVDALTEVMAVLERLRGAITEGDSTLIRSALTQAHAARVNLPGAVALPPNLAEVRVRIKDERGQLAAITGLAAELDVNIFDVEIAHSNEGPTGVIVLLVDALVSDRLHGGLLAARLPTLDSVALMTESITIDPIRGTLDADVILPGSKSLTNRALVSAALAEGTSTLDNCGISDDTEAMVEALRSFGVMTGLDGTTIEVEGRDSTLDRPAIAIDARQSGTTARFGVPMLLCSGGGTITGHPQMQSRPMHEQLEAIRLLGAEADSDRLPVSISVENDIGRTTSIDARVSSQFISGLLLVAPALPKGLELRLLGDPVSKPYIDMTIEVMRRFGADVVWEESTITAAPTGYRATDFTIEPDASTATYPLAAAAIVGGRVRVVGLGSNSIQGDVGFAKVLSEMGVDVSVTPNWIEARGSRTLRAIDVDLGDMSDTAPTFAVLATRATGTSRATGIGFIRTTKESDRVQAAVTELQRLGIDATVDFDGFTVVGGSHSHAAVQTYDDHRIAMSFAVLGLVDESVTITNPGCVAKTFPGFFELIGHFGATARTEPLVLAIDGPAGAGKSTVAAMVARELNLPHLDTGAMYRAVTLAVLRAGIALDDHDAVSEAARSARIRLGSELVLLNGEDVTDDIRSAEVTAAVSPVAVVGGVRAVLAAAQRRWATDRGAAVVEGRDIGSAVFPEATLKIYLDASVEERARRRAEELGVTDLDEMVRRIRDRDHIDTTREHDPLTIAEGAVVIDSSDLSPGEVTARITGLWNDLETP